MNVEKIKTLLNYKNIELIGSNKLNLKYSTDYDFQDKIIIDNKHKKSVLKHFQNIFKVIGKTDNAFITDFKSGLFLTHPLRWSIDEVMTGKKVLDTMTVLLINNLDHCKIDLIIYDGKEFIEYSCNYYFVEMDTIDIEQSLLLDIKKYFHDRNYMKMLKRVLSYRKYKGWDVDEIIEFFNGEVGLLYQQKHRLEILYEIREKGLNVTVPIDDVNEEDINKLNEECNKLVISFIGH
jgi:hypothetical protein